MKNAASVANKALTSKSATYRAMKTTLNKAKSSAGKVVSKAKQVISRGKKITENKSASTNEFTKWLNKGSTDNKVYHGIQNGQVKYTGITKQSSQARLYQHNRNGKAFSELRIRYDNLTRNQARAIEQYFIENDPSELNKINSISKNSKYYKKAYQWAEQYIKWH